MVGYGTDGSKIELDISISYGIDHHVQLYQRCRSHLQTT